MAVLLLRLSAVLQSWGTDSRFDTRSTNREPSKSAVIGMIAAALGIQREESCDKLAELNKLGFAVRVDREGVLQQDYHTAKSMKSSYVTKRYYLADAVFLVALESDDRELLERISEAIHKPVYPLFLGRRSCPPTLPIDLGIRDTDIETALKSEPMLCSNNGETRYIFETKENGKILYDVPVSFSQRYRKYKPRMYREEICSLSEHDPMSEL